jgi:hypothetical protein
MQPSAGLFALGACRAELGLELESPVSSQVPPDLNFWTHAWNREGLKALCLQKLAQMPLDGERAGQIRALLLYHKNQFQKSAGALQRLCCSSPVPFIAFKGHGTTGQQYAVLHTRSSRDMDLLVRPRHLQQFQSFLVDQGYNQDPLCPHIFQNQFQEIDLHTKLFEQVPWPVGISQDELWRSAIPIEAKGLRLSLPHEFLLALSHATTHGFARTVWLLDLALLLRSLGECEGKQLAEDHGMSRAYHWMAELHRTQLGLDSPKCRFSLLEQVLLGRVRKRKSGDRLGRIFLLLAIPGWTSQLRYLGQLIWGEEQSWSRIKRLLKAVVA